MAKNPKTFRRLINKKRPTFKKLKFRKEISAGAIIFYENRKREYLLLQYETKDKYWGFPKGKVERKKQESLEETAFREIREETGLTQSALELIPGFKEKIHYFYRQGNTLISKDVIYFLIRSKKKTVTLSEEHLAFSWLNYKKALKRITHKTHRVLLKKAEEFLS
jgi:8-oxo-dGTP pyrophosphatase MutT (NUDIX family)